MAEKRFVALARVSSREQEREGFSLEVQKDTFNNYADTHDGTVVKLFSIAETATKPQQRKTFKELLAYVKKHAAKIDGLLFVKVDRAARNLFDYIELERLESEYGVPVIYITQPTENTPAGRMMRRTLANMAAYYTEQQSVDVRDGQAQRVKNGMFPCRPPYGYMTQRIDGRSIVIEDPLHAPAVKIIFNLYAYQLHTLDSLKDQLYRDGVIYTDITPRFSRSKLHDLLRDRSYLGEVRYRGQWHPGIHPPLIDRVTFDRVQAMLGGQIYRSHEMTYAGELITCGFCGHPVTGERKTKKTRNGNRDYVYYRCSKYNHEDHPRVRLREADIDEQIMAIFAQLKIDDPDIHSWFTSVLEARVNARRQDNEQQLSGLNRQMMILKSQQEQLLNIRLLNEIDSPTFAAKNTELQDRISELELQADVFKRTDAETGEIALKAFELSQSLADKWVDADYRAKRQLLEIICLNFRLDDVKLVPEMRKPFDVLAEGLDPGKYRGDRI